MSEMKTIVVTGGTGGLGAAVVARLLGDYRTVVLYNRVEGYEALRARLGAPAELAGVKADLTDDAGVAAAIGKIAASTGGLYALVHLAGGFASGTVEGTERGVWDQILSLNLLAAVFAFRAAIPHLRANGSGRIVAVASEAALAKPAGMAAYTVSKSALCTLVELTAKELAGTGITVNAIAPGSLATPAMKGSGASGLIPLERVAETIAFLVGDGAANVSGAVVPLRAGS
ncbi:MAG: SDR family NAD(P)-dependent oxidoreductase [Thermoanaerobaculia bacterium]|jgi:NAD(P)-dependent dehydrogenase (short-subunit alcohol dehydrogenase family)